MESSITATPTAGSAVSAVSARMGTRRRRRRDTGISGDENSTPSVYRPCLRWPRLWVRCGYPHPRVQPLHHTHGGDPPYAGNRWPACAGRCRGGDVSPAHRGACWWLSGRRPLFGDQRISDHCATRGRSRRHRSHPSRCFLDAPYPPAGACAGGDAGRRHCVDGPGGLVACASHTHHVCGEPRVCGQLVRGGRALQPRRSARAIGRA